MRFDVNSATSSWLSSETKKSDYIKVKLKEHETDINVMIKESFPVELVIVISNVLHSVFVNCDHFI